MELHTSVGIDGGAFASQTCDPTEDTDGGVGEAFEIASVDAGGCFCCHYEGVKDTRNSSVMVARVF